MTYIQSIRERPSLRLSVLIQTPRGLRQHWSPQDPHPAFAPKDMTFGSVMPGGYDRFGCVLERNPRRSYPDLVPMSTITVMGNGGQIAWQGRLEKLPDVAGFASQVSPEAVGYQAHLEDDTEAREIYVDRELSKWVPPTIARKIGILNSLQDEEDPSVGAGVSGLPSVITQLTGHWNRTRQSEAWYDARGIPLGLIKYAWKLQEAGKVGDDVTTDVNLAWGVFLSDTDTAAAYDQSGNLRAAGPTGTGTLAAAANVATRRWGLIQLYLVGAFGTEGVQYPVYWPVVAMYGRGLTEAQLRGALSATEAPGVYASDVATHAIGTWAPKIASAVIVPTSFVIPQLAFLEPTTVADILKQAIRFELPDWAVWEGPAFYMNPRGERARKWKVRVGPAQLQEAGTQVSRLWNGVIVQYQDMTGKPRMVGPTGYAGAEPGSEDALLLDTNPENPLNEVGIKKWALLKMGTTTQEGAKQVGRIFLEESRTLDRSGQASIVGHVEDASGTWWPAWAIRGGDEISFTDAADPSYRRVVSDSYNDPARTNQLQLEQPPDSLQALLERLSASLVGVGLQ